MSRPTQSEVDTAVENLLDAASYIKSAGTLLDNVPARFRARVEDVSGTDAIDASLAKALSDLGHEIRMAAEFASEQMS